MKYALMAAAAMVAMPAAANAATISFDVGGVESVGEFGVPGNTVLSQNIGANSVVTGVTFTLNLTAFSPSWLSEIGVAFTDSAVTDGVLFTPGVEDDLPGTATYTGSLDLLAEGLDFSVGADGILRLEFYESFDDSSVSPDGIWNSGTLTFTYDTVGGAIPEPATWAMLILGMGAIGATMRRRQQAVRVTYA